MASAREFGNQHDALSWIKSSNIEENEKKNLNLFIRRFPSLEFYRFVRDIGTQKAPWLVEVRKAIGGFEPSKSIYIQLKGFEPKVTNPNQVNPIWYNWWFAAKVSSEFKSLYLDGDQLIIICAWLENLSSLLAIKANSPNEKQVYEFGYKSIKMKDEDEEKGIGILNQSDVRLVFQSYSDFFSHITQVRTKQDGKKTIVYNWTNEATE